MKNKVISTQRIDGNCEIIIINYDCVIGFSFLHLICSSKIHGKSYLSPVFNTSNWRTVIPLNVY